MATLEEVKAHLKITGDYQDETIGLWMDTVIKFLKNAGAKDENINSGVVALGVEDLWNHGAGDGKLSDRFKMLAKQLALM